MASNKSWGGRGRVGEISNMFDFLAEPLRQTGKILPTLTHYANIAIDP